MHVMNSVVGGNTSHREFPLLKHRLPRRRQDYGMSGFTLLETLGVIGLMLILTGFSAWTYQSLARHQKNYPLTEEKVHCLRDKLMTAHLRAQQGQPQEVSLADLEIDIHGAPPSVSFLPPYGKLNQPHGIRFWAGGRQSWWQFHIAPDGTVACHPGKGPGKTPVAASAAALHE